mmetsp:Transcript_46121/g.53329  ORF Transcript_46121/g.53329 Transcript_46121/m.53329 type:complete len:137 (+) Transcript_46121:126-536(+)|eukprot:CAMPEP_0170775990 /NCGR_PEP_ID=MMETSP0733-20121128/10901_1 /TAXON_ID=186038 /ORGANISM="Fragilariopsis kerguelensis, Strain L26-C5" /LENGTH=136 /DNA_ID=CAMNT_0011118881 /DNA_START=119 /DNA_END=529 /DNA_ORIENTATION=-
MMIMMMQLSVLFLLILFSLTTALIIPQQQKHRSSTGSESRKSGVVKERQRSRVGMAEFESSHDDQEQSTSKWQDIIFDDYVASDWLNMDEDSSCDLFPDDYNTQLLGVGRAVLSSSSVIPTVDVTNVMEYLNIRRV